MRTSFEDKENLPAMANGAPNPVTGKHTISPNVLVYLSLEAAMTRRTHESPVTEEEVLGLGVEGNVGARTLSIMVGTGELCTGGRESTASDKGVGQSGPGSGGGNHLVSIRQESINGSSIRMRTLSRGCGGAIGNWMSA